MTFPSLFLSFFPVKAGGGTGHCRAPGWGQVRIEEGQGAGGAEHARRVWADGGVLSPSGHLGQSLGKLRPRGQGQALGPTAGGRPPPRPGGEMKSLSFQPQPARHICVADALSRAESWPPPACVGASPPRTPPSLSLPARGVSWFLGSQAWRLRPGAPSKPAASFPAVGRCLPCSVPQFPHL